jgi:hypothetical protein
MQSATERRDLRRSIRNVLGTSREEAPTARQVINAATYLRRMMELASGGRFTLAIVDQQRGEFVDASKAHAIAREATASRGR